MNNFQIIQDKLKVFSKKFYTNELIKGILFFLFFGILFFLFIVFIEYFLWLKSLSRYFLFIFFITIELFLLIRFIYFPLFKLFGLYKGNSKIEYSKIIGEHFPDINDKLVNILQLNNTNNQSDLLLASIEQKSKKIKFINFNNAINFKSNIKYLKLCLIPFFILLLSYLTGINTKLSNSFNRVFNYNTAFVPPAPFVFYINENDLTVIQGEPLKININLIGDIIPDQAKIFFNNHDYFLTKISYDVFQYSFNNINKPISFYIQANGFKSKEYFITVKKTPTIQSFSIKLNYPNYTKKRLQIITTTGNITVPIGTKITWLLKTNQTDKVIFTNNKIKKDFKYIDKNTFSFTKQIYNNTNYIISTSNKFFKNYENLPFFINVIKDNKPTILVKSNIDSISNGNAFFAGNIGDDYGINRLEVVYYDILKPKKQIIKQIKTNHNNFQTFFYEFPNNIELIKGVNYELFFRVFDNDSISGFKNTNSKTFLYRNKTNIEVEDEILLNQISKINSIENTLNKQNNSNKELKRIQFDIQNKKNVNWEDTQKINNLIKRQQTYKNMMQRQTSQLLKNIEKKLTNNKKSKINKEELKKRIQELQKLEKQKKLLNELKKIANKLNKNDLIKKTKELIQHNKHQEKSLERILEMTKRFYVEQKLLQLSEKLKNLALKQDNLSKNKISLEKQNEIKKTFNSFQKQFNKLNDDNNKLKEPFSYPKMIELQRQINKDLKKTIKNINENDSLKTKKNQNNTVHNLRQMSRKLKMFIESFSVEREEKNIDDLRNILHNLIEFSFKQENLIYKFKKISSSHPNYGKYLKKQYQLKFNLEKIDDSLFVLSMRIPRISVKINDFLSLAHFNIDESLKNLSDNNFRLGLSNQQYVLTGINSLIDILSNSLDNMKNKKSGKGSGKGESFSLPDLIKKQSELIKKMQKNLSGQKNIKSTYNNFEKLQGDLFQIYKEQNQLRELFDKLVKNNNIKNKSATTILNKMKDLENKILEKGFTKSTFERMLNLKHQLLKLDKATFDQGKEDKRKSKTNHKSIEINNIKRLKFIKTYFNQYEILNRNSLPFNYEFKTKVQKYFNDFNTTN